MDGARGGVDGGGVEEEGGGVEVGGSGGGGARSELGDVLSSADEIVEAGTTNKVKSINAKRGKRRSNRRVIIFVLLCSFVFLLFCFVSFLFFCFLL